MPRRQLSFPFVRMYCLLAGALIAGLSSHAIAQNTITVCQGCQYESINAALATAVSGDTILVEAGEYQVTQDIRLDARELTILGEIDAGGELLTTLVIDHGVRGFNVEADSTAATQLQYLRIQGAPGVPGSSKVSQRGHGMYAVGAVTVSKCIFTGLKSSRRGGAVYIQVASGDGPDFIDCLFFDNRCIDYGAATEDGDLCGGAVYMNGQDLAIILGAWTP